MRLCCSVESFCRLLGGSTRGGMRPRPRPGRGGRWREPLAFWAGAGAPFLGPFRRWAAWAAWGAFSTGAALAFFSPPLPFFLWEAALLLGL